jgi:hypothetical protein
MVFLQFSFSGSGADEGVRGSFPAIFAGFPGPVTGWQGPAGRFSFTIG